MPDARQRAHAGEKAEERRGHARAEGQTFALPDVLAAGELVADHEGSTARRVQNPHARLQLPGAGEKRRQVDARVPIDACLERLAKQNPADAPGGISRKVEFLPAVDPDIGHRNAVPPIPPPDAQRRTDVHGRMTIVVKEAKRVREGLIAGNEERAARHMELLVIAEVETRRPGHPGSDVDRGWRQADGREALAHVGGREIL